MTDKEKIRAEIERLKESGCASPIVICDTLLAFIDSMQEKPVNENLGDELLDNGSIRVDGSEISKREWALGSIRQGYKVTKKHSNILCQAPYSWCDDCVFCNGGSPFHWEIITENGKTASEMLAYQNTERLRRLMLRRSRIISGAGIFIGLLGIPVACMTDMFGLGQIPSLMGGVMALGGAAVAIYGTSLSLNK